jgi:uncharacterized protein (TIGR03083 family)
MQDVPVVESRQVHAALAALVPRLSALIRSIKKPAAPALGEWNVGEVAVHLAQAWEALPALARHEMKSPLEELGQLSELTTSMVRGEPERDMAAVASRIDAAAASFLSRVEQRSNGELGEWLVSGISVPQDTFVSHLLNESLVHGYDIARAEHAPWAIDPADAALALMGFMFPMLARLDPRALVDQEKAAGLRACYEIRVRRSGRILLVLEDGGATVVPAAARKADCHLSAHPTALFLLMWGRTSQWPALWRGQLLVWGRKPWLGLKLRSVLKNP